MLSQAAGPSAISDSSAAQAIPVTFETLEGPNETALLEKALLELNKLVLIASYYSKGKWVLGSDLDDKANVIISTGSQEQLRPMAVLHMRYTSAPSKSSLGNVPTLGFLKMLYEKAEDPFTDRTCVAQLDYIFRHNPCYFHLRKAGIKIIALTSNNSEVDPSKFISVLAVVDDNHALFERLEDIKKAAEDVKLYLPGYLCPRSELEDAVTIINRLTIPAAADCRGAWKLGNYFHRNGHVSLSNSLLMAIMPMAMLKLRYAPEDSARLEIKEVYARLKQLNHPEIRNDHAFLAYMKTLDVFFAQNSYYRHLKEVGVRFVVDLTDTALSEDDLFIPVKAIICKPEIIRRLSNTCQCTITNNQDELLNRKLSFLINLTARLLEKTWDDLGRQIKTPVGIIKFPPYHIGLLRKTLENATLEKKEYVNLVFENVKDTIMSIPLPMETPSRDRAVSNLYTDIRKDIIAIAMAGNKLSPDDFVDLFESPNPGDDRTTHSM